MRWRGPIRSAIVYALLGAGATVLTSWAIHGVQFWRATTAQSLVFDFTPRIPWPVDHKRAERRGIDTTIRSGQVGIDESEGYLAQEIEYYEEIGRPWRARAGINADAVWRRHRRVNDRLPPTPDYPFPYLLFESEWTRTGWRVLVSETDLMHRAFEPERGSIDEVLFVVRPGWPFAAMEVGAPYAELIEMHPPHPTMHVRYAGLKRVEELAAPPRLALPSGIELWAAVRPPAATGSAQPIRYAPIDRFALPLLPIWPGFLLNTIFYAMLLFALIRTPRAVRRARRRRRGRCAACGYNRKGLEAAAVCPECGAAGATV